MTAGADTSHAITFGKPYPVVGAYLLGRDFPVTDKLEISLAVLSEYTPGGKWKWSSIGGTLEARYYLYKGLNVGVSSLLAYLLQLEHKDYPGYSDSGTEFVFTPFIISYMLHWKDRLSVSPYGGIALSKRSGEIAGMKYDWSKELRFGINLKFYFYIW